MFYIIVADVRHVICLLTLWIVWIWRKEKISSKNSKYGIKI